MKRSALLFVVLAACGAGGTRPSGCAATGQCAPGTAQPHLQRTGGNLLSNPSLSGTAGWSLEGGAVYDGSTSRTAGSGSVRLTAPHPEALVSERVPVAPSRTYVFSAFVRTGAWPNLASLFCSGYDAQGAFVKNLPEVMQGTTAAGEWQEVAVTCRAEERFANGEPGTDSWNESNASPIEASHASPS